MTSQEKVVSKFLRSEQIAKNIGKYVLRHAGTGAKGHPVETFEITESLTLEELDNLAGMIVGRAQIDADGLGPKLQRYTLTSFIGEDAAGRCSFRLKGASDFDLDGEEEAGEEAPTMRGLTQQLMRHNEANNRTLVGSMGSMFTAMTRRMESQDRMIEKMMEQRVRDIEVIEDALGRKHERDMEMEAQKAKDARIAFGLSKVSMLIPVMLDKLAGGKTQSTDPTVLMLSELVSSMNVDQLENIRKTLSPEQQIVFITMLKKFQERKSLPEGTPDSGTQKEN